MSDRSTIETEKKREIAWQAQTIHERMRVDGETGRTEPPSSDGTGDAAEEFLEEWRELFRESRDWGLEDRLAAEGLSQRTIRRCVRRDRWPADEPLPEWLEDLEATIDFVRDGPADGSYEQSLPIEADSERPFEEVLTPFVVCGYRSLRETTDLDRFADEAHRTVVDWLYDRLGEVALEALYVHFRTFASLRKPTVLRESPPEDVASSRDVYEQFVARMRTTDGLVALFGRFPLLGRLLLTATRQWRESVAEFHRRIDRDWALLTEAFAGTESRTTVDDVEVLTEDRHRDGRAVFRVDVDPATSVIYKPRSVDPEERYFDLVDRVASAIDCDLQCLEVAPRGEYGWVEHVSPDDSATEAEVERYWERAGVHLGLCRLLNVSDCHFENVIANGGHPVVVDAETLAEPVVRRGTGTALQERRRDESASTVLNTMLLPWNPRGGDEEQSIAGLSIPIVPERTTVASADRWEWLNRDGMALLPEDDTPHVRPGEQNVPTIDGEPAPATAYLSEIERGFGNLVSAIGRESSLTVESIERDLRGHEPRAILMDTRSYTSILSAITSPKCLRDASKVTLQTERLVAHTPPEETEQADWELAAAERTALVRLDVPRFTARGDTLCGPGDATIPGAVDVDALAAVKTSFDRVSDWHSRTLDYVRVCFDDETPPALSERVDLHAEGTSSPAPSGDTAIGYVAAADALHRRIADEAVWNEDGTPGWMIRSAAEDRLTVRTSDVEFYDGLGGLATFFASLHVHGSVSEARTLAIETIDPVRENYEQAAPQLDSGMAGLAGAVYGLCKTGHLLDDPEILRAAVDATELLVPDGDDSSDAFDVLGGSAGALLATLAVYDAVGADRLVDRAIEIGDHLLEHRTQTHTEYRGWPSTASSKSLTGFSHGATGIAYALTRLYDACERPRFRDAAEEALRYERAVYSAEHANWPDYRPDAQGRMDAWCHGRTGALLGRIGIRKLGHFDEIVDLSALDRVTTDVRGSQDQLCCGNAGRASTLLEAWKHTGDETYRRRAEDLVTAVLERRSENGCFAFPTHTPRLYNPSLFMGAAGVGHALLRVESPESVDCLLLFE